MSFDSLDVYQEITVPAEQYPALKTSICNAYEAQRTALKILLDAVQPIVQQRTEAASDGQRPLRIFGNAVHEIIEGDARESFSAYPGIVSDLQELCLVMSGEDDPAIYGHDQYWSVRHVSGQLFEQCWPPAGDAPARLTCHSKSTGHWSFNDAGCRIELHIASDWQGDQWGLNNLMTKALDQATAAMKWSDSTGSIVFTVNETGFIHPRELQGCPPKIQGMSDEEWPMFLDFARSEQRQLEDARRQALEDMNDDIPM